MDLFSASFGLLFYTPDRNDWGEICQGIFAIPLFLDNQKNGEGEIRTPATLR